MRYEKGHKESTRQRIIKTAAARFRKGGIHSVGVAGLMSEAGLTHGGFYSHFSSKEDLVRQALAETSAWSRENFNRRNQEGGLEAWIRNYMRTGHRDHPEQGCAVACLAAELARHDKSTRGAFTGNFTQFISDIASKLPVKRGEAVDRKVALAIFSTLVGALQLSRTVNDEQLSTEILEAGVKSALALAEKQTAEF
jgi:TetR/AcrR family transcriptional repressor of nem operon